MNQNIVVENGMSNVLDILKDFKVYLAYRKRMDSIVNALLAISIAGILIPAIFVFGMSYSYLVVMKIPEAIASMS